MLHVVHHPDYIAPAHPGSPYRFDKYGLVMQALAETGLPHQVHAPEPFDARWIAAVHEPAYVETVRAHRVPRETERRIGFAVTPRVAARAFLTPAGTWTAARLAMAHGFAANMAGGSHHARYETGAGYCVFNDLAVAAHRLLADGDVARVMILDLDVHQGDGTAALMAGRDAVFTLSLHAERNFPADKARSTLDVALPDGTDDDAYLETLAGVLPEALDRFAPELILYQAGVDTHGADRLGRLSLTDQGLARRDAYVMGQARARGIPLASTLGGGYSADRMAVARRHVATVVTLALAGGQLT